MNLKCNAKLTIDVNDLLRLAVWEIGRKYGITPMLDRFEHIYGDNDFEGFKIELRMDEAIKVYQVEKGNDK
jgi:hypothetical protein